MSLVHVGTGEVLSADLLGDEYLDELASVVRAQHRRSKEALGEALDAYFTIGDALLAARTALPTDQAFGAWFRAQEFGFTRQWGHVLRSAAEMRPEVQAAVATQVATGSAPNIKKAVQQVQAALGGSRRERPDLAVVNGLYPPPAAGGDYYMRFLQRAVQRGWEAAVAELAEAKRRKRVTPDDLAGEGTSSLDHGVVPSPRLPKDAA